MSDGSGKKLEIDLLPNLSRIFSPVEKYSCELAAHRPDPFAERDLLRL
jgi:hypothetical protein